MHRIILLAMFSCSVVASADEIMLQVGRRFSIYTPPDCLRGEHLGFSLVLECKLQGKTVRFYLKELTETDGFDPRKSPPSLANQKAYLSAALHVVADQLDPGIIPRLEFSSGGSSTGDEVDALFWQDGFLFDDDGRTY